MSLEALTRSWPGLYAADSNGGSSGVSRFFLMLNCKNGHGIVVNPVSDDIAAITKVDKPFPKIFGNVINYPAESGMLPEDLHALPDRLTSPQRGIRALWTQESSQSLQVPDRRRGEYHL